MNERNDFRSNTDGVTEAAQDSGIDSRRDFLKRGLFGLFTGAVGVGVSEAAIEKVDGPKVVAFGEKVRKANGKFWSTLHLSENTEAKDNQPMMLYGSSIEEMKKTADTIELPDSLEGGEIAVMDIAKNDADSSVWLILGYVYR